MPWYEVTVSEIFCPDFAPVVKLGYTEIVGV